MKRNTAKTKARARRTTQKKQRRVSSPKPSARRQKRAAAHPQHVEILMVNPRRRRRRSKGKGKGKRRTRRTNATTQNPRRRRRRSYRRNPASMAQNPRRRRRGRRGSAVGRLRHRRRARRRNPGATGKFIQIGMGLLAGFITKGNRWLTAQIPSTKMVQDLSFAGVQTALIAASWFFSEPLMVGMSTGLALEGCDIAQFWYAKHAETAKTATSTKGLGTGAIREYGPGRRQINVGRVPLGVERSGATARSSFG